MMKRDEKGRSERRKRVGQRRKQEGAVERRLRARGRRKIEKKRGEEEGRGFEASSGRRTAAERTRDR